MISVRDAAEPVAAAEADPEVLAALLVVALAERLLDALELADVVAALLAEELGALLAVAAPVVALPDVLVVPAA